MFTPIEMADELGAGTLIVFCFSVSEIFGDIGRKNPFFQQIGPVELSKVVMLFDPRKRNTGTSHLWILY